MVNRFILMLLLLVQVSVLNAQTYEENGGMIFKDLMDTSKVFKTLERNNSDDDMAVYYYDVKDTANVNVRFKDGNDCLRQYFDSCYYSYIDFNRQAYKEFNIHVTCTILFDNNLRIRDVRILDVSPYSYLLKPYYGRIKKILLSTEGKWYKVNKKRRWSFYLMPIHIRLLPD